MDVVSFDNGSSYTKVFAGEMAKVKIPTLEAAVEKVTAAIEDMVIEIDGQAWLVGEDARNGVLVGDIDPKIDAKFHGSRSQYVHMCYLLDRIEAHKHTPRTLVISLPYADTDNRELVDLLKKRNHFVWKKSGEKREVRFSNVVVMPQGVGALATTQMLHNPDFQIIAIADIGSCTMDVPILQWHRERKQHVYNTRGSFSSRLFNTALAIGKIRDELRSLPGCQDRKFSYHQIASMIEDDNYAFVHKSTRYRDEDVRHLVKQVSREFSKSFVDEMTKKLGTELWANISQLAIAGGGVYFIEKEGWDCSDRTLWLDEWATVIGQWKGLV